jgi:hypothetical protein
MAVCRHLRGCTILAAVYHRRGAAQNLEHALPAACTENLIHIKSVTSENHIMIVIVKLPRLISQGDLQMVSFAHRKHQ